MIEMNLINRLRWWLPRRPKEALKKKIIERFQVPSMDWSLGNMRRLGFQPAGVVDIGAYMGEQHRQGQRQPYWRTS